MGEVAGVIYKDIICDMVSEMGNGFLPQAGISSGLPVASPAVLSGFPCFQVNGDFFKIVFGFRARKDGQCFNGGAYAFFEP